MTGANLFFNNSLGARVDVRAVAREIVSFMEAEPDRRYQITIGSDSELLAGGRADFVTAVVVHRVGNGGRYFWRRVELARFRTLRDRIIREVLLSIEVAQEILGRLRETKAPEFGFEIHVDVGENGPTNGLIHEVVGMIRAHNFEVRTKPWSYAASNVADRHV